MQGKKLRQEKLFITYQLSNSVPLDNIYRRLNDLLDLNFLYKATAKYYGSVGPKSIDPVVFMKLMIVGYLENLNSDRRIIGVSAMRMDIRYFIGYDIDEELPWHSTLSRTRQLYSQDIFTDLFKQVLKQCVDMGMISGRRQAVDGFFIKANASLDSMVEKEIMAEAETYSRELASNEEDDSTNDNGNGKGIRVEDRDREPIKKVNPKKHFTQVVSGEGATERTGIDISPSPLSIATRNELIDKGLKPKINPSNKTHYNPHDPDAKISVKPGKATALNYLGQVCVDTATHVITHVQVFTAEKHDSQCLAAVLRHVKGNLNENGLALQEIIADTGYSSGDALKALETQKITGYIPNRTQFNYQREGFTYHPEGDYYQCEKGVQLKYNGVYLTGGYWMKDYTVIRKACDGCTLQPDCSAYAEKRTLIRETIDKPYYDRMHVRLQTRKACALKKLRQSTVEPVIGTLVNYNGIKRVNTKGLQAANKCLTMSAVAYNLKKMLKHKPRLIQDNIQTLKKRLKQDIMLWFSRYQLNKQYHLHILSVALF
ncbi:transposase [Mucilaginibacter oryzae]|uniref:Transposase n=1 Tax=Mucilaginibacter oryzae TaxID=468058 RepID=A0A316HSE8_9SPHI|nr:IS1182 family transposase [Mucilaginibacter oryzae]PWK77872.1 transposase [Mucilaginibacter oryzae]